MSPWDALVGAYALPFMGHALVVLLLLAGRLVRDRMARPIAAGER